MEEKSKSSRWEHPTTGCVYMCERFELGKQFYACAYNIHTNTASDKNSRLLNTHPPMFNRQEVFDRIYLSKASMKGDQDSINILNTKALYKRSMPQCLYKRHFTHFNAEQLSLKGKNLLLEDDRCCLFSQKKSAFSFCNSSSMFPAY